MIPVLETVEIPTGDAYPARADVYRPGALSGGTGHPGAPPEPRVGRGPRLRHAVVLLVHGFTGYKTWGFLPYLARRLAGANLTAVALDLSHNGTFPAPDAPAVPNAAETPRARAALEPKRTPYRRPDLFERNTLGREVSDVAAAIDYLAAGNVTARPKPAIGLFAHSRGSVAAVVNAVEKHEVGCLSTWSAGANPDHHTPAQKERWREAGFFEFTLARRGQRLRMGIDYLDDLERNAARYHTRARAAELRIPHLIVHGRFDMAVKPADAWAIYDAETRVPDRRCLLIRTGHTFGVDEGAPVDGDPPNPLVQAADETVRWFAAHLTTDRKRR